MAIYIGCDLGGTNIRIGLVDTGTGQVSHLTSQPTLARQGHDVVIQRMADLCEQVIAASGIPKGEIGGIGVGVPGVLDIDQGLVLFLPNLSGTWPNVKLRDKLQRLTGLHVALLNDARSITLGEWIFGAGRGAQTIACFALGTGIGGGLVINGRLHLGFNGTAGELGHQIIDFNGPKCGCGNRGCLETYASGPAIAAMGMRAVTQGATTSIGALVEYDLNRITPEVIHRAALEGDEIANDIFQQAGYALGIAISNVMVFISPQRVVLTGGVAKAGELLLGPIRQTVQDRVKVVPLQYTDFLIGQLGDNAGVVGAAMWAASGPGG